MAVELRLDREVTLNVLTHFYGRLSSRIHQLEASLKSIPEWSIRRFVIECVNSSTARFGKESRFRNARQSLDRLTEQFEGAIMFHGLRGVLDKDIQSLKQDLLNCPVEDALIYFENTREKAARIAWDWYFNGRGNISDSQAAKAPIYIYAGNERKIFTVPSLGLGKVQIAFQFNPADFPFEFYLGLPVYLVHEYLSHIYRYEFFGGSFEDSSYLFEDGWLYFVAFRLIERNLEVESATTMDEDVISWCYEELERQSETATSDVGLGFGIAKKLIAAIGKEPFNLISRTAAQCPSIDKHTDFHTDLVLSVQQALRNTGYENRKLKQTLGDGMQKASKILFDEGRYEDAKQASDLATKLYPERADAYLATLGNLYLRSGNLDDAHEVFIMSLEKNGRNWESILGESVIESVKGNSQRALELINSSLIVHPQQKQLWNQKAVVLIQIGQVEQALEAINQALNSDARYLAALRTKLLVLNNLDLLDEARIIQIVIETIEQ
jgi:tetratricopeptide (TPR) repeat protein